MAGERKPKLEEYASVTKNLTDWRTEVFQEPSLYMNRKIATLEYLDSEIEWCFLRKEEGWITMNGVRHFVTHDPTQRTWTFRESLDNGKPIVEVKRIHVRSDEFSLCTEENEIAMISRNKNNFFLIQKSSLQVIGEVVAVNPGVPAPYWTWKIHFIEGIKFEIIAISVWISTLMARRRIK